MKYGFIYVFRGLTAVTPFAGVWIEIRVTPHSVPGTDVTPFAGVWIEIPAPRLLQP